MKVVIALPRTGSQSYYHQEIVKKNIGWLHFHEALGHGEVHHQQTHDKLLSTDKSSVKIFPWFENQRKYCRCKENTKRTCSLRPCNREELFSKRSARLNRYHRQ